MRQITYQGRLYNVPEWTRWMAMDATGAVRAYEFEPHLHASGWAVVDGEVEQARLVDGWRGSLERVHS